MLFKFKYILKEIKIIQEKLFNRITIKMGDYNDLKNILNYNGFIFRLNGSDYMYLNHKINLFKGKSDALLNNVIVDEDYQRKELISYLIWVAIIIK